MIADISSSQPGTQTRTLPLQTDHLFDMVVFLEPPQVVGNTPKGNRQILVGNGGEFCGARLSGEILPYGADWYLTRPDGVGELDVRVTLKTSDGVLIYMRSEGYLHFPRELARKVLSGVADPEDYYFRERTLFETEAGSYAWLNSIIGVGTGWYEKGQVGMSIYEVR
jgi:Protein of unknown function (DUF3237)